MQINYYMQSTKGVKSNDSIIFRFARDKYSKTAATLLLVDSGMITKSGTITNSKKKNAAVISRHLELPVN